jgi:hypothetical protein
VVTRHSETGNRPQIYDLIELWVVSSRFQRQPRTAGARRGWAGRLAEAPGLKGRTRAVKRL